MDTKSLDLKAFFIPTDFANQWKLENNNVGFVVMNQEMPFGDAITIVASEDSKNWEQKICIKRTVGDHASDADDYKIMTCNGKELPYKIIALESQWKINYFNQNIKYATDEVYKNISHLLNTDTKKIKIPLRDFFKKFL